MDASPAAIAVPAARVIISLVIGYVLSRVFQRLGPHIVPQMRFDNPIAALHPARIAAVNKG